MRNRYETNVRSVWEKLKSQLQSAKKPSRNPGIDLINSNMALVVDSHTNSGVGSISKKASQVDISNSSGVSATTTDYESSRLTALLRDSHRPRVRNKKSAVVRV
jgi:hypothetical protein